VSAADSLCKHRLTRQLPLHALKHLVDIFLDGSLDEERIKSPAKDAAHQLIRGIEAGIGLVAFGFQRPGESALHGPMKRLPDLESAVGCMPARGLESNNGELLVEGYSEYSEGITHAQPAPTHPHNSFHDRCTFRKVLRVINELEDLLDRRFDRHSGVNLGRDSASLTDLPKRIGRAYRRAHP
jgi:hypothetical protein